MGDLIQWADYVKALETIAAEQEAVSGMTVAEAAAALNYTKTASGMYLKTVMTTAAESTVASTATEAAAAASAEAATTTAVNLTLVEGSGGTASVAGIGSVALPIAACIAAAGGGYLIGKELDKIDVYHNFWDDLVFNTCDFVTGQNLYNDENGSFYDEENAPTVPLLYDATGATFLPSDMLSQVKNFIDTSAPETTLTQYMASIGGNANDIQRTYLHSYAYVFTFKDPDGHLGYYIISSDAPIKFRWGTPNKLIYANCSSGYDYSWGYIVNNGPNEWSGLAQPAGTTAIGIQSSTYVITMTFSTEDTVYEYTSTGVKTTNILYSNPNALPDGITKYTPSTTINTTPITDPNGNTWGQVFLPSTPPTEMPDGEPVPEVAPDPSRLTPYIPPYQPQPADVPLVIPSTTPVNPIILPDPEPDTSTAPYPAPNPAVDPSQGAEPVPPPGAENLPDPANTGTPPLSVLPSVPSPAGLLHVYNPTPAQVDLFGQWLWTTFSGDLIDTISKLFNNPMDAVIGLHELYCTPLVSDADVNIRAGFLDSNVPSRLVTTRYKEIKCGALSVPEYWGNYLDYSPYTKSYCYLPFIGIVELNTDDIVGSGVEITYRIDTYNGSCIALITTAKPNSAEAVTYQFEGNCAVTVPITSGMMTAAQNALIGIATTALSAGATAAVTVATGGTALPAAAMLGTVAAGGSKQGLTSKNQVQYSGSFGSSFGAMGIKVPFLIIKRPRQKVVYGYNENYGYPAHKMVLVSACSGYLKAIEVDVISPTATESEKKMIEQLLKSGVFVD